MLLTCRRCDCNAYIQKHGRTTVLLMGRGAVAAGVSIMVVFMPLGYFGLRWLDVAADKYAAKRDVRQGKSKPRSPAADRCWLTSVWAVLVSELLSAIKLIKLCGWEDV